VKPLLRYGDSVIFQNGAVRHLGFVLRVLLLMPVYVTTRKTWILGYLIYSTECVCVCVCVCVCLSVLCSLCTATVLSKCAQNLACGMRIYLQLVMGVSERCWSPRVRAPRS